MSKVSVIIPVYNAASYIKNCIKSVQDQTFQDFEIVAVNDGSKDNSLEIITELAKEDSRIKVIDQENQGVSGARNTAIYAATGEFITMLDCDDTLPPNALEDLLSQMKDDIDIACSAHYEKRIFLKKLPKDNYTMLNSEISEDFRKFDRLIWFPWAKMLRRNIIVDNNIKYDRSISFGEDHIFNLEYAKHMSGNISVSDKYVYIYHMLNGGICSKYHPNMHELQKYVLIKVEDYWGGHDKFPKDYHIIYTSGYFLGCLDYYIAWCSPNDATQKIKESFEVYKDFLDDDVLAASFSDKQLGYIENKDYKSLKNDYIIHNPKKTLFRKFKRNVRRILEKIVSLCI